MRIGQSEYTHSRAGTLGWLILTRHIHLLWSVYACQARTSAVWLLFVHSSSIAQATRAHYSCRATGVSYFVIVTGCTLKQELCNLMCNWLEKFTLATRDYYLGLIDGHIITVNVIVYWLHQDKNSKVARYLVCKKEKLRFGAIRKKSWLCDPRQVLR